VFSRFEPAREERLCLAADARRGRLAHLLIDEKLLRPKRPPASGQDGNTRQGHNQPDPRIPELSLRVFHLFYLPSKKRGERVARPAPS